MGSHCPFRLSPPQFRYKKRVYKQAHLDEKQLAKLHSKVRGRLPPGWRSVGPSVHPSVPPPRSGQFSGQRFFFPPDVTTQMAPGVSARAPPNTAVLSSVTRVSPMTT